MIKEYENYRLKWWKDEREVGGTVTESAGCLWNFSKGV